eukprot:IDg17002t1
MLSRRPVQAPLETWLPCIYRTSPDISSMQIAHWNGFQNEIPVYTLEIADRSAILDDNYIADAEKVDAAAVTD